LDVNGRFNEKRIEIKGEIGSTKALIHPDRTCPVNLVAKLGSASFTIDGSIKDTLHLKDLAGTLTAEGPSISELLETAGMAGPSDLGPFHFTAKLSDTNGTYTVETFRLQAGTDALAQVTVSGTIKKLNTLQGARFDFDINGKDIANLEKLSRQPIPVGGAFSASGKLSVSSANRYEIDSLKVRFGENFIQGIASLDLADQRPVLSITLSSQKIVLKNPWSQTASGKIPKNDRLDLGPLNLSVRLEGLTETIALKTIDLQLSILSSQRPAIM